MGHITKAMENHGQGYLPFPPFLNSFTATFGGHRVFSSLRMVRAHELHCKENLMH